LDIAAENDRRDQACPERRVVIDLALDEPDHHRRALGVPDQDEGPAVAVIGKEALPAREQAVIGNGLIRGVVRETRRQTCERDLAIHRRIDIAVG